MSSQNPYHQTLIPMGLFLILTVTACGGSPNAVDANSEPASLDPKTEVSETASADAANGAEGAVATNSAEVTLTLAGDGARATNAQTGETQDVAFESDIALAQTAVAAALEESAEMGTNAECGAGPMTFATYPNGFTLNAMQDQFVGWSVRDEMGSAELTTAEGIGVRKTLAELEKAYQVEVFESSLGTEFNAEDQLFGLLSSNQPDAVITYLWAGIGCNFR